ncbi:MAG: HAD-IA family hydrolase [Rhodospirillaceae bacterium]|nr:HAD-IA family hydrolase [Rhodospirillaceae bacterium]
MSDPVRLVVFDLDGTIVDSLAHISRAVVETAKLIGIPAPLPSAVPRVIGLSLDEAIARLFPDHDAEVHAEVDRVYRKIFAAWRAEPGQHEPLFDGTHAALEALDARGILLGIATGKHRRGVDFILDKHGLTDRFVTIQTPDTAPGKPHPGMLPQAMSETGAAPERTVMVGDTIYDIAMARAAGTHAVGVSWGNHAADELHGAGAHRMIDRLAHLTPAVDELLSAPAIPVPAIPVPPIPVMENSR